MVYAVLNTVTFNTAVFFGYRYTPHHYVRLISVSIVMNIHCTHCDALLYPQSVTLTVKYIVTVVKVQ